jgi:hypothetical protein
MRKFDLNDAVYVICAVVLIILFMGEPDLLDAIISNVMKD